VRAFLHWLVRTLFGFRAYNASVLKSEGPVLLLSNHVSWWDWALIGVCLDEDWKLVTSLESARTSWIHNRIMVNRRTFPVDMNSPYAVKHIAEYLENGGRLVLFPEGRLSRTGSLMKLFDGTGFLVAKTRAKVITAYLRNAKLLPFSPNPLRKKWFPRVSAHFSSILSPPEVPHTSVTDQRERLTDWAYSKMVRQHFDVEMEFGAATVPQAITEAARGCAGTCVLQDFSGQRLTYRRLITGANLLAGKWSTLPSEALTPVIPESQGPRITNAAGRVPLARGKTENQECTSRIGVLLPNVNAMPVTILSLWAANKIPAVLNYTGGPATLLACAGLAGLRHVITSRKFLERLDLAESVFTDANLSLIFLEDVRKTIGPVERLGAALAAFVRPELRLRGSRNSSLSPPDEIALVLFTSGSEGLPKAVELTHNNVLANIRQMLAVIDLGEDDRLLNALPLFHCFGLVIGLLLPLVQKVFVYLYLSPLHYRIVPSLFYHHDCSILFGTNTFLQGYGRKAHPYDFRTLRYVFAGAEKLQESTTRLWMEKFGIRILEGYGATECGPCLSANTPLRCHVGSVGQLLPGIEHQIEPVEGIDAPNSGRLFVRGPNVMRGYINPDANTQFQALNGWYDTGDIVRMDEDGFLFILGRLRRFAKISGEMVSLTAVEQALMAGLTHFGPKCSIAVVAVKDEEKGEQLVLITNEPRLTVDQVRQTIRAAGLTNLSVPREIKLVPELPHLGTGKLNYRKLQDMVQQA
jgi:acyl-[acyl-carrier-protein]-phospholipid O-acyltransferase/long-chain-fatty-acid--[acyl-carrier-protein] ligase